MIEVLEKDHRIHIYILFKKNLLSAHWVLIITEPQ